MALHWIEPTVASCGTFTPYRRTVHWKLERVHVTTDRRSYDIPALSAVADSVVCVSPAIWATPPTPRYDIRVFSVLQRHKLNCSNGLRCRPSVEMICGRPLDYAYLPAALCNPKADHHWPFELKTGTPVTPAFGNVYANFGYSPPFCFRVTSQYGDGHGTDGRARSVMLLIRTAA